MSYIGYPYVTDQAYNLEFEGQYIKVPNGTTTQRDNDIPVAESGMLRFNTTESTFEGYDGEEWGSIGDGYEGKFILEDSTIQTLHMSVLPFYLKDGTFSPICLRAGGVPFLLEDGITIIDYKVN